MGINNKDFKQILLDYEATRNRNRYLHSLQLEEIYKKHPDIKTLNDEIVKCSVNAGKQSLLTSLKKDSEYDELPKDYYLNRLDALNSERAVLLKKYGIPETAFEIPCDCPYCHDTGYIDNRMCNCMSNKIIDRLYETSNLKEELNKENFSTFNLALYDDTEPFDNATPITPCENIKRILHVSKTFVETFGNPDNSSSPRNLVYYGDSGVGKTFMTHCIAKALLDKGFSVLYLSAISLFDLIESKKFDKDETAIDKYAILEKSDLLIIDDLGTELSNSFTDSELYNLINLRNMTRKSTIISTNLGLAELRERYSERIFSRLIGYYTFLRIVGQDIRSIDKSNIPTLGVD